MADSVTNVNMFKTQSPYEQQIEEMKRRQQMAEMLQQQAFQPLESQVAPGGMVVPTSPVLGLAKMLQGYVGGKQLRDIEKQRGEREQLEGNKAMNFLKDIRMGQQQPMSADDALGASLSVAPTEAQRMPMSAMDKQGAMDAAMLGGSPQMRMAAQLAAMKPEAEEYGTTPVQGADGKYYLVSKSGKMKPTDVTAPTSKTPDVRPVTILRDGISMVIDANTGKEIGRAPVTREPREPLEKIIGPDGKPILVPASQAVGKTPFAGAENPTQGNLQDAYNINRVVAAAGRIKEASSKDPNAIKPGYTEGLPLIGTKLQSGPRQIVESSQGEMLDALVTLATGMSYTKDQLEAARGQYLPQIGDKPERIASKKAALQNVVEAGRARAGRGWTPKMDEALNAVFGEMKSEAPTTAATYSDPLKQAAWEAYKRNQVGSGVIR